MRMAFERILPRVIPVLAALLILVQIALLPVPRSDGHLLNSDGGYYYAYMRSLLLDRDLDISNDVVLYNARVPHSSPAHLEAIYIFSIGPGVLWSPFFLLGHATALGARALGVDVHPDGFSLLEEAMVVLASVAYVVCALVLLEWTTARLIPEGLPPLAVTATFLTSPAVYYAVFEPTMSHTIELFSVALFFWALLGRSLRTNRDYVLLGVTAGLMFLVRWQNVVLLVAVAPLVRGLPPFAGHKPSLRNACACLLGASPVIFMQLLFWKMTLGSFITVPQGGGFLHPFAPRLLETLGSTRHGLFSWHPALVLGLVGLAWLRPRALRWPLFLGFIGALYVCSIVDDWWAGDAFGMRRMIGTTPLFVFGLSTGFAALRTLRWRAWLCGVLLCFAVWNAAFMVQYRLGLISPTAPLTWREMILDKFLLPVILIRKFGG